MFDFVSNFLNNLAQKIVLLVLSTLVFLGVQVDTSVNQVAEISDSPVQAEMEMVDAQETKPSIATQTIPTRTGAEEKIVDTPILPPIHLNAPQSAPMAPEIVKQEIVPQEILIPQARLNEAARKVVVNIFCLTKTAGVLFPITGSGVVIDARGVILTNAHVAQYYLLKDYKFKDFLECVIRGGSPAVPLYRAELLYLPPSWIEKNALGIKLDRPTGTGEDDFALLFITQSIPEHKPLPAEFIATPFEVTTENSDAGDPVLLASYPAGFLGEFTIASNLWISSSLARIMKLFTFKNTEPYTKDAFSLGGTILAQEGSSGGGVFSLKSGSLIGIFSTSILEGSTDKRDLRAISLRHIDERMKTYTGENLQTFLIGDLEQKKNSFNEIIAPQLTKILTDLLDKDR